MQVQFKILKDVSASGILDGRAPADWIDEYLTDAERVRPTEKKSDIVVAAVTEETIIGLLGAVCESGLAYCIYCLVHPDYQTIGAWNVSLREQLLRVFNKQCKLC